MCKVVASLARLYHGLYKTQGDLSNTEKSQKIQKKTIPFSERFKLKKINNY